MDNPIVKEEKREIKKIKRFKLFFSKYILFINLI